MRAAVGCGAGVECVFGGVVSWRWGLSHVSTLWWREAQWRCEDTVLRWERLQTCSHPAAYVATEAAAEEAIKEVGRLGGRGLYFLVCVLMSEYFLSVTYCSPSFRCVSHEKWPRLAIWQHVIGQHLLKFRACDFVIAMRNLYVVFFSLNLLHVAIVTQENVRERSQPEHGGPMAATKNVAFPAISSSEESHRQGVIGEYADLPESTEVSLLDPDDKVKKVSRPTQSSAEELSSKRTTQTPSVQEPSTIVTRSTPSRNVHQPSLYLDQKNTLSVPPGPDWNTGHATPTEDTSSWTTSLFIGSQGKTQSGKVTVEKETGKILALT